MRVKRTDLISGSFVTVAYFGNWYVGCVQDKQEDTVTVSFLDPPGPSPSHSYKFPYRPDILDDVIYEDILTIMPLSTNGRTWSPIDMNDEILASNALTEYLKR